MISAISVIVFNSPLTPLENALRSILEWLNGTIGLPWAWAIVALTIMVRILLVPLTVRQIHSMQALQRHAPQMKEIQKKYKGDKKRQNEEMMKFYKENQINPAASCLPILAQFPVFISLYLVLRQFSKHPPEGDLSWLGHNFVPSIADHANAHWSGYVLLAIYAASQIASTYFMSATMDKAQRTIMMILPLFFITFLLNFPVGLVIYWVTTNLWTVGQGLVTRRLVPRTPVLPPVERRSSRTPPAEAVAAAPTDGNGAKTAKPKPKQTQPHVKRRKKGGQRK